MSRVPARSRSPLPASLVTAPVEDHERQKRIAPADAPASAGPACARNEPPMIDRAPTHRMSGGKLNGIHSFPARLMASGRALPSSVNPIRPVAAAFFFLGPASGLPVDEMRFTFCACRERDPELIDRIRSAFCLSLHRRRETALLVLTLADLSGAKWALGPSQQAGRPYSRLAQLRVMRSRSHWPRRGRIARKARRAVFYRRRKRPEEPSVLEIKAEPMR